MNYTTRPRPFHLRMFSSRLRTSSLPPRLVLIIVGFLATAWFLFRVIPKPSRAAYPCMKATAPFMSAFVLYLLSAGGTIMALRRTNYLIGQKHYSKALFFLLTAFLLVFVVNSQLTLTSAGSNSPLVPNDFTPNEPFGEAQGIIPGRVVWTWDSTATNFQCTNTSNENGVIDTGDDAWFMAKNNDAPVIDSMVGRTLRYLTGTTTNSAAWHQLFIFFNQQHGLGNNGYASGEKILLKINCTSAYGDLAGGHYNADLSRTDHLAVNPFAAETNPYVVLALLRQLTEVSQVPQEMIYVGDPARNIYKEHYQLWHQQFPNVHYLGNDLLYPELSVTALGRTAVAVTTTDRVFFSDHGTVMPDAISDKLFTVFDEITYLINIPTMKAHATAGITLAAKNHFGSFTRQWAMHLHKGLMDGVDDPTRLGYGLYRVQTDLMMHNLLSGKNLLIIVDGLYPGDDALGVPTRWQSHPFNNNWCSSVLASLDPVAIESVCHDFLRAAYNGTTVATSRPNWSGVDDYLHQAADSSRWPDNIRYDPDNDGIIIASLGVHEHWNNPVDKQYTRNLGTGNGIELFATHQHLTGTTEPAAQSFSGLNCFPNPAKEKIVLKNTSNADIQYTVVDASGSLITNGVCAAGHATLLPTTLWSNGFYYLIDESSGKTTTKILVIK